MCAQGTARWNSTSSIDACVSAKALSYRIGQGAAALGESEGSSTLFAIVEQVPPWWTQRKWGRSEDRPHSRRRVAGPEGPGLTPDVSPAVANPEGMSLAAYRPALAPAPVPSGAGYDPKIHPLRPGGSETDCHFGFSSGSCALANTPTIDADGIIDLSRPCAFAVSTLRFAGHVTNGCAAFAPPRGISPSPRMRFQNPFSLQAVTPSVRRANPRFR